MRWSFLLLYFQNESALIHSCLAISGALALVLCTAAIESGVPLNTIRIDALCAAAFILTAIASGSLLNRQK
jgi:hypothetical protein